MKVIKRDGRAVDYNREKIVIAIEKANNEVRPNKRASKEEIKGIIKFIEEQDKKRMLVEDIQDIIEEKLMEIGKYELSKKYIVYRYTRALVRKQNTTDETILGLIKNQEHLNRDYNKTPLLVSTQRDYIACIVSKDLTKRILLPEKISKAHEEGILHFHASTHFLQPMINSCFINLKDMLENGTVINGILIETPKSFKVACIITTQIIATIAANQYGEQNIFVKHLGKYLRKSKEKLKKEVEQEYLDKLLKKDIEDIVKKRLQAELTEGIQTLKYQLNTQLTTNGKTPLVTLFLDLVKEDEYIEENAMIIEEILKQEYQGIKDEKENYIVHTYPKIVYVLNENNNLNGGKYDYLTELAMKCSIKNLQPSYISEKFLSEEKKENGSYKFEGMFNQGVVSINLPQIGIIADENEERFWELLDERLELCYEALMCRHYSLLGTKENISPIHWRYGAIARLNEGETIDKLLQGEYSTLSLGYIGLYELTKLIKGESHTEKEGETFALKVVKHLKQVTECWKKETGIKFILCGICSNNLGYRFAKIDKEKFGIIQDVTDKEYYTNSYHIDARQKIEPFMKLKFEKQFKQISSGECMSCIQIDSIKDNKEDFKEIIKFIHEDKLYVCFN